MFQRVVRFATVAAIIGGVAFAAPVSAQEKYPVDTVTLVTHSSPGGGSDVYLREMVQFLGPIMGVDFGVENVKGGSGAKAIAKLATSPADGSIFYASTPTYINMSLLSNPDYSYKDVEPLVNLFMDPQVLYVRKDSPLTSFADVIAAAKANPGNQKWGTGSPASQERQALEKFKVLAGVDATVVTHDGGGDMMINVLNGSLDLGIGEIQEFRGQLDAGEVRVIGVFTDERLKEFPGPKGLSPEVIHAWEVAIPKVLEDPKFQEWYRAAALVPAFMPHDKFVPFVEGVVNEQTAYFKEYNIQTLD
jgi:tripartite-type tricarboxylate transporter receptor subunit TctC